jgi:hypothetical protein
MSEQDLDRINVAVRECLARCYASADRPVLEVGQYLTELRASGWADSEVSLIRATVAKFLRQVAESVESREGE